MVLIASTGYLPIAVSPDSITADVPSRIALATSLASARVGFALTSMDASIWVAVITGLPFITVLRMSFFWVLGTSASGSSTPRSPRATMMPLAAAMMLVHVVDAGPVLDLGNYRDIAVA